MNVKTYIKGIIGGLDISPEDGMSYLEQYAAHRRKIIDLLERYLSRCDENQNYEEESVLYNILYPKGESSDTSPYDKHNLWLLDERLTFHRYLYSYPAVKTHISNKDSNSRIKPDLTIYDVNFVYGDCDESGVVNSVIMFEFKHPNRKVTFDQFNKHMRDQVINLRKGKIKDYQGKNIQIKEDAPVYFFYVCDATTYNNIKNTAKYEGFCETSFNSLLRIRPVNKVEQIITYQTLLTNARHRNLILLEKLGIK